MQKSPRNRTNNSKISPSEPTASSEGRFNRTNSKASRTLNDSSRQSNFGILQFDAEKSTTPPQFTEPATIEAMQKVGVLPDDLIPLSKEFQVINLSVIAY
mgnify:CR=1 FL=1